MQFQTAEELEKIADLLKESDFDRAGCQWHAEGSVPPGEEKRKL